MAKFPRNLGRTVRLIAEDTAISLGAVGVIVGGILWLSHLAFTTAANSVAITSLEKEQRRSQNDTQQTLQKIAEDVGFIRGHMEALGATKSGRKRNVQN